MKKEENVHKAVCKYLKYQYPGVIFFSEPSGIRVSIGMAKLLQSLRSCDSLPDLFIAEPKGERAGLFIEIKNSPGELYLKSGMISGEKHIQEQKKVLELLTKKGYHAVFGPGFEACVKIIDAYLTIKNPITPELLEKTVCRHYQIEPHLLHCKSQKREITEPRQIVMSLIYSLFEGSNKQCGVYYRKDHATVTHSRKTIQDMYDTDRQFREKINRILGDLGVANITFYKN